VVQCDVKSLRRYNRESRRASPREAVPTKVGYSRAWECD